MCRKNRALGWCLISGGVGALLALLLGGVLSVLGALAFICAGLCLCAKR